MRSLSGDFFHGLKTALLQDRENLSDLDLFPF
jgi:hypothetical protein